ncbi:uncharacterized protein AB675_9807 [Cyphellophora attinorum]|uniref:F-box domain-containing protein n=1 Tax=Cyphellophora attinorum TaxID=1664694 RepID=A0A0N1HX72_9EURO|nr:uncharacterized protein AB675_9807 [Phialophora attinorum]KPI42474.1 hypothetical protein AB675_9807 [Phialophora attinorum]
MSSSLCEMSNAGSPAPEKSSAFLDHLSYDVRRLIYEHLFRDSSGLFLMDPRTIKIASKAHKSLNEMVNPARAVPDILLVNRQIFWEALPMFQRHVTVGVCLPRRWQEDDDDASKLASYNKLWSEAALKSRPVFSGWDFSEIRHIAVLPMPSEDVQFLEIHLPNLLSVKEVDYKEPWGVFEEDFESPKTWLDPLLSAVQSSKDKEEKAVALVKLFKHPRFDKVLQPFLGWRRHLRSTKNSHLQRLLEVKAHFGNDWENINSRDYTQLTLFIDLAAQRLDLTYDKSPAIRIRVDLSSLPESGECLLAEIEDTDDEDME